MGGGMGGRLKREGPYIYIWLVQIVPQKLLHCKAMMLLLLLSRFCHDRLCVTPWTAAHQAPLPMGLSRQESWSGLISLKSMILQFKKNNKMKYEAQKTSSLLIQGP